MDILLEVLTYKAWFSKKKTHPILALQCTGQQNLFLSVTVTLNSLSPKNFYRACLREHAHFFHFLICSKNLTKANGTLCFLKKNIPPHEQSPPPATHRESLAIAPGHPALLKPRCSLRSLLLETILVPCYSKCDSWTTSVRS